MSMRYARHGLHALGSTSAHCHSQAGKKSSVDVTEGRVVCVQGFPQARQKLCDQQCKCQLVPGQPFG